MSTESLKEVISKLLHCCLVGEIKVYAGATIPSGWLVCDGRAISRTTYKALFDVIGTKYGAGNGSSTFNLPNLSGRVPIGVSSTHALATSGGAETHTLTTAQIPAHTHGSKTLTGWFSQRRYGSGASILTWASGILSLKEKAGNKGYGINGNTVQTEMDYININATHEHTSVGSGQAHNNMQPFLTMNYIIFVGGYCVVFARLSDYSRHFGLEVA